MNKAQISQLVSKLDSNVVASGKAITSKEVKASTPKKSASELLSAKIDGWNLKGKNVSKTISAVQNAKPSQKGIEAVALKVSQLFGDEVALEYINSIGTEDVKVRTHLGWLLKGRVPTKKSVITMSKSRGGTYALWHELDTVKTCETKAIEAVISGIKVATPEVKVATPEANNDKIARMVATMRSAGVKDDKIESILGIELPKEEPKVDLKKLTKAQLIELLTK